MPCWVEKNEYGTDLVFGQTLQGESLLELLLSTITITACYKVSLLPILAYWRWQRHEHIKKCDVG